MREKSIIHLKLYLGHIELFFKVREECDSSLMPAIRGDWMRLGVSNGKGEILDSRAQVQVHAEDNLHQWDSARFLVTYSVDSAKIASTSAARSGWPSLT